MNEKVREALMSVNPESDKVIDLLHRLYYVCRVTVIIESQYPVFLPTHILPPKPLA